MARGLAHAVTTTRVRSGSEIGERHRAEVGVLDRPPLALRRGDGHARGRGVGLPGHHERGDRRGGRARVCSMAAASSRVVPWAVKSTNRHGRNRFVVLFRWSDQVARSLSPAKRGVKNEAADLDLAGLEPIKRIRIPDEIANRLRATDRRRAVSRRKNLAAVGTRAWPSGSRVSRSSVRDAIRRLEVIGLLETRHGQGTYLHELSVDKRRDADGVGPHIQPRPAGTRSDGRAARASSPLSRAWRPPAQPMKSSMRSTGSSKSSGGR